jgi:hypothetical protein
VQNEIAQHIVHKSLKCRRCIRQPEGHDQEFKMPVMSPERRLGHVVGVHEHLMVATAEIQLGEEFGAPEFVEKLVDDWDWKHFTHRAGIEGTVVYAEASHSVVLLHQ